jgi:hypothetical protein
MQKKVYCKNCCHKVKESFFTSYSSIQFMNGTEPITNMTDLCKANAKITISLTDNYNEIITSKHIIIDSCASLNRNNNCVFYSPNIFKRIHTFIIKLLTARTNYTGPK